jgi:hypothetical protein
MTELTGTTWKELRAISATWGYTLDIMITPNGFVESGLKWGDVTFKKQGYGSERAAIDDMLNIMRIQIDLIVKSVERERGL